MSEASERVVGTVKFFNTVKEYGFIELPGQSDVFVHKNNLPDGVSRLMEKQRVSFEIVKSNRQGRGDKAVNVRIED